MKTVTEKDVHYAWVLWQMEENRDRGYNYKLCQRLRKNYYELQTKLEMEKSK